MLMPAAVLIVLVLAAMAIDLAHLQLGQRQLRSMAADAANDAAGAGVDVFNALIRQIDKVDQSYRQ